MSTGGNLGGASFQVRADIVSFERNMQRAKEKAARESQQIANSIKRIGSLAAPEFEALSRKAEQATGSLNKMSAAIGGSKGGHLGLGLMAIGNMVDDMQYGFRSIVNNIPQVVYLMGGSAGLAGGAAVAAVAMNQLVNRWDNLIDALQGRWLNVAASDLERLRIQTEKAGEAFDKLMAAPSEAGAREIGKLKEAMTDFQKGGAGAVFKGLAEAIALEPGMRAEETPAQQAQRQAIMNINPAANAAGDALRKKMADDIKAMDEKLAEQNRMTAKTLMGRTLLAGEEGENARTTLKRLIEKLPNAFDARFRARLQQITPEQVQGEIDLENTKKARERARGVAGQLLGGPLGTQLMLGAGGGGPLGADQISKMIGGPMQRRLAARGLGGIAAQMAAAGMTGEQTKGVLGSLDIRKMYEAGKKRSQELGVPLGPLGQVDPRVLDEVYKKTFAEAMKNNKDKPGAPELAVGKALKQAGVIGQIPKEVLAEMKAQLADRKKELMLGGMTGPQAEAQILKDQQKRAFGGNMPAMMVGITQLAKMSQVNALNGAQDIAKRSLDELIAIRTALLRRQQNNMAGLAIGPE